MLNINLFGKLIFQMDYFPLEIEIQIGTFFLVGKSVGTVVFIFFHIFRKFIQSNKKMSNLVEFVSLSNPFDQCSDHFIDWLCRPRGINKYPTVWLDGDRLLPKNIFKNNISLTNSKIRPNPMK